MKRPGLIVFGLLFFISALGMVITGAPVYTRLFALSVLLIGGAWLWTSISLRGLRLTRQARSLRASVGDIFEENFEVQNGSRIPRLWVEVLNQSNLPLAAGSRLLTWIGARNNRTYLARTWLTRRGAFPLGPTTFSSGDPFGLFTVKHTFQAADSLLVLPLIVPIRQFTSPPGLLPGGKAIRQRSLEITPHASGIREYVTGDPLKAIHWPSTARRGEMMVKEFERDPQAEVWLFLDAFMDVQAEKPSEVQQTWQDWMFRRRPELSLPVSTIEYGVTITASLAHYFIEQRRAVGLVTSGPVYTVIPAERSERQESKVLETLAFVNGQGQLSLPSLVDAQSRQMPLGSSAILITPSLSDEVLLAVETLQRRNQRPVVILMMAESFGGKPGGDALAEKLAFRNIPVCKVYCGADLAETLGSFTARQSGQELVNWQKLTSIPSI
jgi:uncharacterized protein (DUF58 family)